MRAQARELAAVHVYGALLRDAIGMAFRQVDTHLPLRLRRDRIEFAQSVVQSVMAKVSFTALITPHDPDAVGGASLRTWLTRRLYWKLNTHLSADRKRFLRELNVDIDLDDFASDEFNAKEPDDQLFSDLMIARVWATIDTELNTDEQTVIILNMAGYSNDEGAANLGLSLATFKRYKHLALKKLSDALTTPQSQAQQV